MSRFILCAVFMLMTQLVLAQSNRFLVLNDGTKVPAYYTKLKGDTLYYSLYQFEKKKKVLINQVNRLDTDGLSRYPLKIDSLNKGFFYLSRAGEISLYYKWVGNSQTPGKIFYAMKQGRLEEVFSLGTIYKSKGEMLKMLLDMISDDVVSYNIASSEGFNYSYSSLISIINRYNFNKYSQLQANSETVIGQVNIYRKKRKIMEDCYLHIKGEQYFFNKSQKIEISAPVFYGLKAVLSHNNEKLLYFINASEATEKYYEISYDSFKEQCILESMPKRKAEGVIKKINEYPTSTRISVGGL